MKATGQCVCGAVRVEVANLSPNVGACHCGTCRRWGGGPLMAVDAGNDVNIEGEVSIYDSSEWAERGFCGTCGSHIFYRLKARQQHIMAAGLFGELPEFVFDHQVFIDEKPGFYSFSGETKDMTGPELFAMFAGGSD
ncbi:MAG: hypothetical protein ACI8W8_004024 [Rhodothermales bacterium]|jgi:hypothetical protein